MKSKFLLLISLGLMLFAACDPNKEIYDELASMQKPYKENISIVLADADYTTISKYLLLSAQNAIDSANAKAIDTYNCFSPKSSAEDLIPYVLEKTYLALDSASTISAYYNYDNSVVLGTTQMYTLLADDYLTFTGEVATNGYFNDSVSIKMPAFLLTKYPDAVANDIMFVSYKFDDFINVHTESSYFVFNGTAWAIDQNVYVLTKADYNAMDITGNYLNFSASKPADSYLPSYLGERFPWITANGSLKTVAYLYFDGTITIATINSYYLSDGEWQSKEVKSGQFIHNGIGWFFDPTVKFTMSKSDYQIIVDYITVDPNLSVYLDLVHPENTEYYYGASAYYGNYDLRPVKHLANDHFNEFTDKTDTEIINMLLARIPESILIMLKGKFPDAQPFVNGIPVYYEVTFDTYEPIRHKYSVKSLCTGVGQFEYVEAPTLIQ